VYIAHSYAQLLKLPGAENINSKSFKTGDELQVNLAVDKLSRQLTKIEYINNNIVENYSNFGLASTVNIPDKIVAKDTFQKAIQNASK
jgi:hypothetical protein